MRRTLALVLVTAGGLAATVDRVGAQATWSGGAPVYDSDVRRAADAAEAERAERRKNHAPVVYPKFMQGGDRPDIKPVAPPIVNFERDEEDHTIIVDTAARKLYYVLPGKKAYEYPISVGRDGFTWSGTERISRIAEWPTWTPPPEMHKRVPGLPITVTGGLRNPQGARALYLGNTIYRIHGTNNDRTVGRNNSSGCFRLTNEHVVHLASIVKVGTKVRVLQSYNGGVAAATPALPSLFSLFAPAEEPAAPAAAPPKAKAKSAVRPAVKKAQPAAAVTTAAATPAPAPAPARKEAE
jgi:lipoprotein-anchoring transpeptidase ErfK/SrfK